MPTASDVKAVTAILENPEFPSAKDAAKAVIEALDAARRARTRYAVAVQGLPTAYLYGDFENRQEAVNWCKRVGLDVVGLSLGVIPLMNRESVLDRHKAQTAEIQAKTTVEPLRPKRPRAPRRKAA